MGLGILVGGFALEYISYNAAFWVAAAMQLAGVLLFFFVSRYNFQKLRLPEND
jgi:predicted MFS family arabinose efflux permease